jgi:hypothetical protein
MKKSTIIMICGALALLVFTCAPVYAQSRYIKADIPFDFTIGDKLHPAGNYTAMPLANSPILQIRDVDNSDAIAVGTFAVESAMNHEVKPMFVFRRYGNQYFLAEVWMGLSNTIGCELPKSAKERQVAKVQPKPELIMVAAK